MEKIEILNKYNNEEERLLVSKILDKIKSSKTKNKIENTDFLNMYQKKISKEILNIEKCANYKYFLPYENAEKSILIIYPEKYSTLFEKNIYEFSQLVKIIRIILPNELKSKYQYKDYLSGIMKLGVRRDKIGDISVFEDGADLVVSTDVSKYLINNLNTLKRFSKSEMEELEIKEIRKPIIKKEKIRITITSLRLDTIVSELANCSRTIANNIIDEQRVFINYEIQTRNSKIIEEKDIIVIRGKGKFEIKSIEGKTKKGKIVLNVEHYI